MRSCERCGDLFKEVGSTDYYCVRCNDILWKQWEVEEADNLKEIDRLIEKRHSHHCACRIVWGDGECTCDMEKRGYDPYWWQKGVNFQDVIKKIKEVS